MIQVALCRRDRSLARLCLCLLAGSALTLAAGCGKKGPPLPPLRHGPERVTSLACHQKGRQILVTGVLPDKSQSGEPMAPIQELRVFRLDRGIPSVPGVRGRAEQRAAIRLFTKEAKTIVTLSGESLSKAISGRWISYVDPDPVPGRIPNQGQPFTYALTVVDAARHSSPLSQLVSIQMLPPPLPPSNLRSEISEKKIRLSWEPPASEGKDQTLLYNIYRSEEEGAFPAKPRNDKPLAQPFFEDEDFSFGKIYYYAATSLIEQEEATRESETSLVLQVKPVDLYPPTVPTGLSVSAENGVIKLYWFPNSESDLGGYRIYRSEKEDEGFEKMGDAGPAETTFVDSTAKPGVRYYYAITAVDQSTPPNESARSEVHGDRLPPQQPDPTNHAPGAP
jgi:fibronectin type 3 domain-containing protein